MAEILLPDYWDEDQIPTDVQVNAMAKMARINRARCLETWEPKGDTHVLVKQVVNMIRMLRREQEGLETILLAELKKAEQMVSADKAAIAVALHRVCEETLELERIATHDISPAPGPVEGG